MGCQMLGIRRFEQIFEGIYDLKSYHIVKLLDAHNIKLWRFYFPDNLEMSVVRNQY